MSHESRVMSHICMSRDMGVRFRGLGLGVSVYTGCSVCNCLWCPIVRIHSRAESRVMSHIRMSRDTGFRFRGIGFGVGVYTGFSVYTG